ncbi:hypothetical protein BU25DRAFT_410646 [Macroventuria anomochaeta]|uniref:Uncharacterized protein n=1 Tax=Macroventuria anomochaeta TaxID=301207 RepID=A0ACB6S1F2_9PLEO|nr:uncharacterized protein BU25DRAFT_410646 [Macroventuria anomochaeta]KAF2627490.1 hypothetical protein BU25DRAFT_410646 [Macroventuria anomochaeta]
MQGGNDRLYPKTHSSQPSIPGSRSLLIVLAYQQAFGWIYGKSSVTDFPAWLRDKDASIQQTPYASGARCRY